MESFQIIIISIFILVGLLVLNVIFFKGSKKEENRNKPRSKNEENVNKVQSLIKKTEKENPELVNLIRSRVIAEAKEKRVKDSIAKVKDSTSEDISLVLNYWLNNDNKK